jgi:acetyl/propionyl-CoA carboxylase alpha subunit
LRRAIEEFQIAGVQTNLSLHLRILEDARFLAGDYDTNFMTRLNLSSRRQHDGVLKDLAVAAAVAFMLRNKTRKTALPDRVRSGWHRSSRRLPV